MKGIDIVVKGNIGHMSAFMAQSGHLVVCGDAGDALGDSIYEAKLFVRGSVKSLGADCLEKEMRPEHHEVLTKLLKMRGLTASKPMNSDAMARPASSTTSISITRMHTDDATITHRRRRGHRATFDDYTLSEIRRAAATGIYDIRGGGREASASSLRRPAVSRRVDLAIPSRRLP